MGVNNYFREIKSIADKTLPNAKAAIEKKAAAEQYLRDNPWRQNIRSAEDMKINAEREKMKSVIAECDEELRDLRAEIENGNRKIKGMRQSFIDAVKVQGALDPASVDPNGKALIDSGLMNAYDLRRLCDKYKSSKNTTMLRLMQPIAEKQYSAYTEDVGAGNDKTDAEKAVFKVLEGVLVDITSSTQDNELIETFDNLSALYSITSSHPDTGLQTWEETAKPFFDSLPSGDEE